MTLSPIFSQAMIVFYEKMAKELNKKLYISFDGKEGVTIIVNNKAKSFINNLQAIDSEIEKFIRETK